MSAPRLSSRRLAGWQSQLVRTVSFAAIAALSTNVAAQTWVGNRTTPRLPELVAVDATGESGWPFGAEDVAGDGLGTFSTLEQTIDARTVYAATDAMQFWARIYFSDPDSVAPMLQAYIFVDTDQDAATGRSAAAPEIDPAFTSDPSDGGYEFVIAVSGAGALTSLWEYRAAQDDFMELNANAASGAAEAGVDVDPVRIAGPQHGYVQASINLSAAGLTQACDADLFVRAVSPDGADLDVGDGFSCVPRDSNADGTPDVAEPPAGCTLDSQCPGGGRCVDGSCQPGTACATDADCAADELCADDGRCLARPGPACSSTAECGELVCTGGQCVACRSNAECADDQTCSSTGKCTAGVALAADEKVEGGALNCAAASVPNHRGSGPDGNRRSYTLAMAAAAALWIRRRRLRPA